MRAGTGSSCLYILVSGIWWTLEKCLMKETKGREGRKREWRKEGEKRTKGREERRKWKHGQILKTGAKSSVTEQLSGPEQYLNFFHFDLFRFGTLTLIQTRNKVAFSLTLFTPELLVKVTSDLQRICDTWKSCGHWLYWDLRVRFSFEIFLTHFCLLWIISRFVIWEIKGHWEKYKTAIHFTIIFSELQLTCLIVSSLLFTIKTRYL